MEVMEAILSRRSIRAFSAKEIPGREIGLLKQSIVWAPSAGNLQSRKFYFVFNIEIRQKLAAAALDQYFIAEAPLVVVGCTDNRISGFYGKRGSDLYSIQDSAASVQNLLLAARSLGLGAVWIGAFDEHRVASTLNLPRRFRPVALVPVGFPAEAPEPPPRNEIDDAIEDVA